VVDWQTILWQVLNFLVLVWLLKKLLYGRIIKAMDAREATIAGRLRDAERKRQDAEAEAARYRQQQAELDAQRGALMAEAKQQADATRAELIQEARREVDALETRWREAIERQRAAFLQDLRQRATRETFAIARRVLADLADAELEARIVEVFLARLEALPDEDWQALADSVRSSDVEEPELVVRSVFELPDERRGQIEAMVRDHVGDGIALRFEQAFDPLCGIELRGEGRKVAWTVEHYLGGLEESFADALERLPRRGALRGQREHEAERETEEEEDEQSAGGSGQEAGEEEEGNEHEQQDEKEHDGDEEGSDER